MCKRKARKTAFFIVVCMAVMMFCSVPVFADWKYPSAYWNYHEPFINALENNDKDNIIKHGEAILDCLKDEPLEHIAENIVRVYEAFVNIYQERENYEKVVENLKEYIKLAEYLKWNDSVKLASMKLLSYELNINVYAETKDISSVPYYNQRVEPKNGIYIGRVYTEEDKEELPIRDNEGIVSFYALFGREHFQNFDWFIRPFDDNTKVLHFAWNLFEENNGLQKVLDSSSDEHIISTLKYIDSFNSPVMLRIFAEMNVWEHLADADKFKEAYIKIAKLARQHAPDAALIFSPNAVSHWSVDKDAYYPGDEYVDWVGVSLYTSKYFPASNELKPREDFNEAYYFNGIYENAIVMLKDIVSRYGHKKPILIVEGAAGYNIKSTGEDLSPSAVKYMNQVYRYASMVFPQVKAAIYFDVELDISRYGYRLANNQTARFAYFNAINANPVLNTNLKESDTAYITLDKFNEKTDALVLSTYAVFPNYKETTVEYFINGNSHTKATEIPYTANIDIKSLPVGGHNLKVTVKNGDYSKTFDYIITKTVENLVSCKVGILPESEIAAASSVEETGGSQSADNVIKIVPSTASIFINGTKVNFEAYNINDSNYFKLRDIAYALNNTAKQFNVIWDDSKRAMNIIKGETYVSVGGEMTGEGSKEKAKTVVVSSLLVYIDNEEISLTAYNIDGNTYFKLIDIGKELDFSVKWDDASRSVIISTDESYAEN